MSRKSVYFSLTNNLYIFVVEREVVHAGMEVGEAVGVGQVGAEEGTAAKEVCKI